MDAPKVVMTVSPHVTISYDTAERPHNQVTFPLNAANVADVTSGLADELKKAGAIAVLAAS
jgi:hypothetical protein